MSDQLLDELNAGTQQRKFAEDWAIGIVKSKIKSKYDLDFEITATLPFNPLAEYKGNQRFIIDFPEFAGGEIMNDCRIYEDVGYICIVNLASNTWDESQWQSIGNKGDIYYLPIPAALFSLDIQQAKGAYAAGFYNVGDLVWWNDHTYSAKRKTITGDHDTNIQYPTYNDIPTANVFPNDPSLGYQWWEDLGTYFIEAGTLPVGTEEFPSPFTLGDNRDSVLMQCIIDLALWMLHKRIAPQNIPKMRNEAKDMAFEWLTGVKNGDNDSTLETIQPDQGNSFRWGSDVKLDNFW